ncbi:CD40 ligand-like [Polyodon spathula]|uniref:CD40 ligand-like n=1 Tax=Polyodon spathula TaxID=7913 RepID=UPI001B7DE760|nr:CD40 ligand-like [Polyodon spathula]
MINTYTTTVPPPPPVPSSRAPLPVMKSFIGFLGFLILAQMVGSAFLFMYIFKRMDEVQTLMSYHEDMVVLKRIKQCEKPSDIRNTHLDCGKVVTDFQKLLPEIISRLRDTEKAEMVKGQLPSDQNQDSQDQKIIAQLTVRSPSSLISLSGNTIKLWSKDHMLLTTRSVIYEESTGSLRIKRPGNYYIYSQTTFVKKPRASLFSQCIVQKDISGKETLLLRSYSTPGRDVTAKPDPELHTLYQGAVFTLKEDDRVYVNVSDLSVLHWNGTATLFGLVLQ